ncbi:MAG: hypothetical protein IIB08_03000, partial [Bacteroidetes bacterium]|nr:hypothetical protein [Bacteroidota bacterium]
MKSIAFIFLLLLLNPYIIYSQDDQSLYLGGGKIRLGMTEAEVIEQSRNSSYMKAVSNEGFISLIDNNNELIGIVTISSGKATSICKEWLIDSSLDRDIAH